MTHLCKKNYFKKCKSRRQKNGLKQKVFSTFHLLCLKNIWAPGPKHVDFLKKSQVFFSLRRPAADFQHQQGQQRTAALKDFNNSIQNTKIRLNWVET